MATKLKRRRRRAEGPVRTTTRDLAASTCGEERRSEASGNVSGDGSGVGWSGDFGAMRLEWFNVWCLKLYILGFAAKNWSSSNQIRSVSLLANFSYTASSSPTDDDADKNDVVLLTTTTPLLTRN
nr:hypothetical protein Itr_chr03CG08510 [Ipomoea trifida]